MAEAVVPPMDVLTLAQVKQFPADQQKILIGERLYGLIALSQPMLAGKITGMFLESGWSTEELFALLSDEASLAQKVRILDYLIILAFRLFHSLRSICFHFSNSWFS
jgi:hypothetical protein